MDKMMLYIWENHRGKAVGLILGLLGGILVINYGFWKSVFIVLLIALGYVIGKAIDDNEDFDNWINKFRGR
ncbi:MAG: DUF2273 domain-containing protein [Ignavibacteriales bacterium]